MPAVPAILAFLLGLDSMHAAIALGAARMGVGRRRLIAAAFGLADGVASFVGLTVGGHLRSSLGTAMEVAGAAAFLTYGAVLICRGTTRPEPQRLGSWWFLALPIALSLDNLGSGVGLGLLRFPVLWAVLLGTTSAGMFLVGFRVGSVLATYTPAARKWAGAMLVILAGLSLMGAI